jgi:hypothetical protein
MEKDNTTSAQQLPHPGTAYHLKMMHQAEVAVAMLLHQLLSETLTHTSEITTTITSKQAYSTKEDGSALISTVLTHLQV